MLLGITCAKIGEQNCYSLGRLDAMGTNVPVSSGQIFHALAPMGNGPGLGPKYQNKAPSVSSSKLDEKAMVGSLRSGAYNWYIEGKEGCDLG